MSEFYVSQHCIDFLLTKTEQQSKKRETQNSIDSVDPKGRERAIICLGEEQLSLLLIQLSQDVQSHMNPNVSAEINDGVTQTMN